MNGGLEGREGVWARRQDSSDSCLFMSCGEVVESAEEVDGGRVNMYSISVWLRRNAALTIATSDSGARVLR